MSYSKSSNRETERGVQNPATRIRVENDDGVVNRERERERVIYIRTQVTSDRDTHTLWRSSVLRVGQFHCR